MRTLIVDDEPSVHDALKTHLSLHHPEVKVLDSGYSKEEGLKLIRKYQPDLLFLDIHMPDGTGFDLMEALENITFQVIFITADNQYAQTAIGFGALDYLLKPIGATELTTAILKAKLHRLERIQLAQMQIMRETLEKLQRRELPSKMSISTTQGVLYFSTQDIIRLEAMQNFTEFKVANDPRRLIASSTLTKFENDLKPFEDFIRVHRSHLINLNKVVRLIEKEKCYVEMTDGSIVPVSNMHVWESQKSSGAIKFDIDNNPDTDSLKLYFSMGDFSEQEIAKGIAFLSELYREIGGDGLVIDIVRAPQARGDEQSSPRTTILTKIRRILGIPPVSSPEIATDCN